jgi:hypothetical protein
MKKVYLVCLLLIFFSVVRSQQCTGNACGSIQVSANPRPNVAWQFTNTSGQAVRVGIRLYFGGCSDPSYMTIAPNSFQYWGMGSQGYCTPFTADYAGGITESFGNSRTIDNSVTITNSQWNTLHLQVRSGNTQNPDQNAQTLYDGNLLRGQSQTFSFPIFLWYRRDTNPDYPNGQFTGWTMCSTNQVINNP